MCSCNLEGQLYAGLHQKKHDRQEEGGDSTSLLCTGETPLGLLHPALRRSTQEGHGHVGASPEEGHEDDERAETLLL